MLEILGKIGIVISLIGMIFIIVWKIPKVASLELKKEKEVILVSIFQKNFKKLISVKYFLKEKIFSNLKSLIKFIKIIKKKKQRYFSEDYWEKIKKN